jgi:2,3-bisphosphoglycerate-dependent phosphoglycerate mutase
MIKLVLVRHGESIWNKENKFTGWTDVDLSDEGRDFAVQAGKLLYENGYDFDIVYTSVLKRAIDTCNLIINEMHDIDLTIKRNYKLNERHYGALQGLNKKETADKYGEEQVHQWRRGYAIKPPALEVNDSRFPGNDPLYRKIAPSILPVCESLEDTVKRVVEYYNEEIKPVILEGKSVMIVAHGNSLRGLIKYLDNISDEDIMNVEIPTGVPLIYELDDNLQPIKHYYLKGE